MKGIISISFILILLFCFSIGLTAQEKTEKSSAYEGMVLIPAGSFQMGSNDGDSDEKPVHKVYISKFWMDKYEVTNGEYKKCVDAGSCRAPSESKSYTRSSYYGDSRYDSYPVIYVSWDDAWKYCQWKGKRLPTEAEWEYAARGGLKGKKYPNGDTISESEANFGGNDTQPVGYYSPNGYGLYDMAGNVSEWVSDWYEANYYKSSPPRDPQGPSNGEYRVVHGGSWYIYGGSIRVSHRSTNSPTDGNDAAGFRCAR
jgi:formylglycine-generating enzyme required for sulfatase activity